MARSARAVEARDRVSALGGSGAFRIWGTAVCVLSAGVVDHWGDYQPGVSVDYCERRVHLARAGFGRVLDVYAGAPLA